MVRPITLDEEETPVDRFLKEQQRLQTPVTRVVHVDKTDSSPDQAAYYKSLIPLTAPGEGEQYSFEVDLDKCTGCKACVSACHSLNGLEDEETWRDIGLIHGGTETNSYQQTITTACHHCTDPGCMNGCPVNAYEKDDITGIVMHLDDQCIGCQYCVFKCPYDVPKYSEDLGIVRKCDMCHSRLATSEAPACVQACPNEAIAINIVNKAEVESCLLENPDSFLPSSPNPQYTFPTTTYKTKKTIPENTKASDSNVIYPQHPHYPLVLMLVLTQFSVGALAASLLTQAAGMALNVISLTACAIGLAASTIHLGKPLKAWRAFLGLRKSWLSREIVVFGAYFPLLAAYTGAQLITFFEIPTFIEIPHFLIIAAGCGAMVSGLAGVFCSIMIYHDTPRRLWHFNYSGTKFFGATLIFGLASAAIIFNSQFALISLILVSIATLAQDAHLLSFVKSELATEEYYSARIHLESDLTATRLRFVLLGAGGIIIPLAMILGSHSITLASIGLALCLGGLLAERYLFFRASVAPKMPGGIA